MTRQSVTRLLRIWISVAVASLCTHTPANGQSQPDDDLLSDAEYEQLLDNLILDVKDYTCDSLRKRSSPQHQSYLWLQNHPRAGNLTEASKQQQFSLATFYLSMTQLSYQEWLALYNEPLESYQRINRWMDYETNECQWDKLDGNQRLANRCNPQGEIVQVVLPSQQYQPPQEYHLVGSRVPPELSTLPALEELQLESRFSFFLDADGDQPRILLQHWLPVQLANLSHLRRLHLEGNILKGTLPSLLGLLSSLTWLDISNNDLEGSIPSQLGLLANTLQVLNLSENRNLSGTFPTQLGLLRNLQVLNLDYAQNMGGTIPSQIGGMQELSKLRLWFNGFSGSLPTELYELTRLQELVIRRQSLTTSSISSLIGNLDSLSVLDMPHNGLQGTIPTQLFSLSNLTFVHLSHNNLQGNLPPKLPGNLTSLLLWNNSLQGSIPPSLLIESRSHIESLNLMWNDLSGPIPSQIALLTKLKGLNLQRNGFSGQIPTEIGLLRWQLEHLLLPSTPEYAQIPGRRSLEGPIPSQVGRLYNIRVLELSYNNLTSIPTEVGLLRKLHRIQLDHNAFGTLPTELYQLTRLHDLHLDDNIFSGRVPSQLALLNTSLESLVLSNSTWSGPLPTQLGQLSRLHNLRLNGNSFSKAIPSELGLLNNLHDLRVDRNPLLEGTLPSELAQLSNLLFLHLRDLPGLLAGDLPTYLASFTKLRGLRLFRTPLQGTIPRDWCHDRQSDRLGLDIQIDCQQIACPTNCTCECII